MSAMRMQRMHSTELSDCKAHACDVLVDEAAEGLVLHCFTKTGAHNLIQLCYAVLTTSTTPLVGAP